MAEAVWDTLKQYGLIGRVSLFNLLQVTVTSLCPFCEIIALVMDNATNNDTLALGIQTRSLDAGFYFSAVDSRMRCMPHTIHLAAIKVCVHASAVDASK
jgi:hypothetical protein